MTKDSTPPSLWNRLQDWAYFFLQIVDLRVALVMGLLAFLVAVSVDSGGNAAAAADLPPQPPIPVVAVPIQGDRSSAGPESLPPSELITARRLHHGTLTSAIMTSNRLTEAHFFTDLPTAE